ncbi:FecR family protein [Persicobacter diffluens]|uniref:Anti-sigma factor n=1 Tax=Persicobacter diffluens TaxID=981 RepID=A0AAN5ALX9_9BACT|nr:anti-sigma factor [Persicobacter diffluens]
MKKFEAYKATDFLQEDGFVDWGKNPDGETEDIRFWGQWVALHPEKRQEIERAKNIHDLLAMPEGPFETEKSRVWSRLQSSIIAEQQTEIEQAKGKQKALPVAYPSQRRWMKVAAAFLLMAFCSGILYHFSRQNHDLVTVKNLKAEASTVMLQDGSSVILSSGASLTYPKKFAADIREVSLKGQAFFEVAKSVDRPFLVQSSHLTTKVLGTSFMIKDNDEAYRAEVGVVTGKVAVYESTIGHQDIKNGVATAELLQAEEGLVFYPEESKFSRNAYQNHISQTLNFEHTPVREIVSVLEQMYGVEISYDQQQIGNCKLNAKLLDMSLQHKIALLSAALGCEFKLDKNSVALVGGGC